MGEVVEIHKGKRIIDPQSPSQYALLNMQASFHEGMAEAYRKAAELIRSVEELRVSIDGLPCDCEPDGNGSAA